MKEEIFDMSRVALIKKTYAKCISENDDNQVFSIFAMAIDGHEFHSQSELTNYLCCNKAHTSRTLFKMQLKGLVKPISKTITLTEKGKEFAKRVKEKKLETEKKLVSGIENKDLEVFNKVLGQIIANAKLLAEKETNI